MTTSKLSNSKVYMESAISPTEGTGFVRAATMVTTANQRLNSGDISGQEDRDIDSFTSTVGVHGFNMNHCFRPQFERRKRAFFVGQSVTQSSKTIVVVAQGKCIHFQDMQCIYTLSRQCIIFQDGAYTCKWSSRQESTACVPISKCYDLWTFPSLILPPLCTNPGDGIGEGSVLQESKGTTTWQL